MDSPGADAWLPSGPIDLLAVSNGHGEDAIAAHLLHRLAARYPEKVLAAFPLVGQGLAYDQAGVRVLFRSRPMPSGGFGWQSLRLFLQDVAAGFLSLTVAQADALRRLRARVKALLLVGDIYPVILTAAYPVPKLLVATARSDYIAPHLAVEARMMARSCRVVFARDALTAAGLRRQGVQAVCLGNVMMDMLEPAGLPLGIDPDRPVLALLPGSRRDAPDNLAALAQVAQAVIASEPNVQAVAALASPAALDPARLRPWRVVDASPEQRASGLEALLVH